ncbi:HD domain-containing protein [uncultured Pseudodesulfovibrio sp.]|uniref:HD domain-containing protein n=1 Tax=uncultured Pseudodesulfovibrio sp. TaxID=2035858 RepID=UPI0029C883E9|nr:HD domain-containing protein [uncultured Pseudodesulfovibrio sp.]
MIYLMLYVAQMNIYLAGGAVRDLLLGRKLSDRDYLVMNSSKEEFQARFPKATEVGHSFPIFLLERQEYSFPRAHRIEDELESRDLTVNAMLLDSEGNLFCHPNSLQDLHNRSLRPTSRQAFIDDPLRVFRAARFWAKMPEFTPHDELIETMRFIARKNLLKDIAPDRIGQETRKALKTNAPGNYLRLLSQTDCLTPWFSEFKDCLNIPAGPLPYHDSSVIEHTARTMDCVAGDELCVWMALCHDIGKSTTDREKLPTHHGHDRVGIQMASRLARRIRMPNTFDIAGSKAAEWHMIAGRYPELRPGTKVDLLYDLHRTRTLEPLFELVQADMDEDYSQRAKRDLQKILSVKLTPQEMNQGTESGKRLRELRAQTLSKRNRK